MPTRGKKQETQRTRPPARTPEGRENQLVDLAIDVAEKQLKDGTASAQVISHYLKLGSTRESLEQERLKRENELLRAKVAQLSDQQDIKALYQNALDAMRTYSGRDEEYGES